MRKFQKSLGALGLVAALAVSVLAAPSQAATNNSITVAEVTAGGGGVQQIFSPWINSFNSIATNFPINVHKLFFHLYFLIYHFHYNYFYVN